MGAEDDQAVERDSIMDRWVDRGEWVYPKAASQDEVADCDDEPDEPDRAFEKLTRHLDKKLASTPFKGMAMVMHHLELFLLRQYFHMRPKGDPGRPKGTWRRVDPRALDLWKQGKSPAQICSALEIPRDDKKSFKDALRSAARRLPKDERLARMNAK